MDPFLIKKKTIINMYRSNQCITTNFIKYNEKAGYPETELSVPTWDQKIQESLYVEMTLNRDMQ